jgi:hypothetical protein
MLNYEDQPDGCKSEESLSKHVKNSNAIEMAHPYASIISAVTERFKEQS